jgi:site-specific DNA recombinase
LKAIVREHAWLDDLASGRISSIEELAAATDLHPKVIRQGLRLAFLAPGFLRNEIEGNGSTKLNQVPKLLPLP